MFVAVYTREAHAADEWPLGPRESVPQHRTLAERLACAKRFVETYGFEIPLVIDDMSNAFQQTFASWPERYYCLNADGTFAVICEPCSEWGFDTRFLDRWLAEAADAACQTSGCPVPVEPEAQFCATCASRRAAGLQPSMPPRDPPLNKPADLRPVNEAK